MIKSTGALLLFVALSTGQVIASDVAFRGNLLGRPCHVSGGSLDKHVVFETRAPRDFQYPPGCSSTELLVIRLENCHVTAVGKVVALTFKGTEEVTLPGHLGVAGMNAGRLGIALPDTDGSGLLKPDASHNKSQEEKVIGNSLEPPFSAYVVTTPGTLRTKSVVLGGYGATATFESIYRQQNFCTGYFR